MRLYRVFTGFIISVVMHERFKLEHLPLIIGGPESRLITWQEAKAKKISSAHRFIRKPSIYLCALIGLLALSVGINMAVFYRVVSATQVVGDKVT